MLICIGDGIRDSLIIANIETIDSAKIREKYHFGSIRISGKISETDKTEKPIIQSTIRKTTIRNIIVDDFIVIL